MKLGISTNILRHLLQQVYFINGTAYAGKSTMVRMLAERFNGIHCGENYHAKLDHAIDPVHQPNMGYFQTMSGWPEFLNRTPEAYAAWIEGCSREASELEIIELLRRSEEGRPIFVDTNIPVAMLREISDYHRVAIMVAPQSTSVDRFFDRSDPEKQFLLQQMDLCPDPAATHANFRRCLERINSPEIYDAFVNSGFFVHVRDEDATPEQTCEKIARHFGLID